MAAGATAGGGACYVTLLAALLLGVFCQGTSTSGPRFVEPIRNVTVAVGRDATLSCAVENLGDYKVAWIHIDRQMILTIHKHLVSRLPRFSVSHDNQKTWLLHVSGVQQEDRGRYMCQVNTNPMISQVGHLQVVVPPNIVDEQSTPSTVSVREHQNVSLTCAADGVPAPTIMWRREDGGDIALDRWTKVKVYDGERLNLTRISRTEMGAYLCIASNGVPPSVSKRITVDVEFAPMMWVPNQLVGAPVGTDVTIDCHTEAYPRAISYWVYNTVMLLPTSKYDIHVQEIAYRSHMKLTVRDLAAKDFGNYRCISKNSLGETEGSIRLYEILRPSPPPKPKEMRKQATTEYKLVPPPAPTESAAASVAAEENGLEAAARPGAAERASAGAGGRRTTSTSSSAAAVPRLLLPLLLLPLSLLLL